MTKEAFLEKLETLGKPYISSDEHRYNLKLTLVNAQKSSRIGYALVLLPCLFLSGIILKYYFQFNWGIMQTVEQTLGTINQHPALQWFILLVLIIGPMIAIALNLLAILHFSLDRQLQEVQITLRLRWANLLVIFICLLLIGIFGLYIIIENSTRFGGSIVQ